MLARAASEIPVGNYIYEPKWDGFRALVYRAGDSVELVSRSSKILTRYFPELVAALRSAPLERCVLDGEIVVVGPAGLDFDLLSARVHPAESRIALLAQTTPASFVAFDLLCAGGEDLTATPFVSRRAALERLMGPLGHPLHLTPATTSASVAREWFSRFEGAGLDGVVAKPADLPYMPDKRVMVKVKHERSGDFVVGGFRWYKADPNLVGSLMLGLWHQERLEHVGVIGSFPLSQRHQLAELLAPHRNPPNHPWQHWAEAARQARGRPVGASRWSARKDLSFETVSPVLVVEATFEHLQGRRLRHTARFSRWRPDRDAASCRLEDLEVAPPTLLSEVFQAVG